MLSYMSTTYCEDEDEARVMLCSLRSIPHTTVQQIGAAVLVSFNPDVGISEDEKQRVIMKIERLINALTSRE